MIRRYRYPIMLIAGVLLALSAYLLMITEPPGTSGEALWIGSEDVVITSEWAYGISCDCGESYHFDSLEEAPSECETCGTDFQPHIQQLREFDRSEREDY